MSTNSVGSKADDRFVLLPELKKIIPAGRATYFRWEKAGIFPARRKLGPSKVGWLHSEIMEWLANREKVTAGGAE